MASPLFILSLNLPATCPKSAVVGIKVLNVPLCERINRGTRVGCGEGEGRGEGLARMIVGFPVGEGWASALDDGTGDGL
jgi:hypothetical protein